MQSSPAPSFDRVAVVRGLTLILEWAGAALLFAMMLLTFVDVIGRYWFSAPVIGGFEVTEIMLATIIFCGLPLVTLRDGHISADLIEDYLPAWFRVLRDRAVYVLMTTALGYIGIRLFQKAGDFVRYNDQTAVLNIPLAPVCYAMSVLAMLSAIITAIFVFSGRPKKEQAQAQATAGAGVQ
jgi:TRAP-type C4-dicarboxylate transport system permease small subunit